MPDSGFVFSPAFRVATDALEPVAGGTLEFYLAGTNTPTNVYSDSTLSTSLGGVVYLDSGGHPVASSGSSTKVIVYTGSALIKIIAKDSDGVTLATYDNVRCAQDTSALSGGGSDGGVESVVSKTANYSVLVADDGKLLHCDPTGGTFTITLPSAITAGDGFEISIRHAGTTTTNVVHIATVSSQTIARNSTTSAAVSIRRGGEALRLVSNGANWVTYGDTGPDFNESPIRIADRLISPPGSPTAGARYLISSAPVGDWASYAQNDIVEANGSGGWIRYRPYTDCGWLAFIADENVLAQYRDGAWVDLDVAAPVPTALKRALFTEQQAVNVAPTALISTAWTKSNLNTTVINTITGASLASSVITLPAGTYLIKGVRPFYFAGNASSVASAKIRLQDTTNNASYYGTNEFDFNATAATVASYKNVPFFFTVTNAAEANYELQYYVGSNYLGGVQLNLASAPEVYTQVEILDLASLKGPKGDPGDSGYFTYPESFGAVADGTTDDSAAFRDAINYIISVGGGTLLLRDRTYRITNDIGPNNITGVESIAIVGSGPRSILDFSGSITVGLALNSTSTTVNQRPRFLFSNFRIITSKKNAGTAISVSYADGVYAHDSVMVDGLEITQNVARISDSGADYGYWSAGMVFTNVRNASIARWAFSGEMDLATDTEYGLRLLGDSIGVRIGDFRVQEATTAIAVEGSSEGIYLSDYEIVTCRFGVRFNITSGGEPLLSSVNGHITTSNAGIYATNVIFGQISNTNFYAAAGLDSGTWPTWYGVLVDGVNSQQWIINGCSFSKEAGRTGDTTVPIQISTGTGYRIHGNNFYGLVGNQLTFPIVLAAGVTNVSIIGNGYTECASEVTNSGATSVWLSDRPREVLSANRTYYVRTDGSDSNAGLANTAGGAFLTIQKAVDVVRALDLSIYNVTIQVAAGTYTAPVTCGQLVGSGTVTIQGDTATPWNVIVSTTSATAFTVTANQWYLRGFRTVTTTAGAHIIASGSISTRYGEWEFGATGSGWPHIEAQFGATVRWSHSYYISGGASSHWSAESGGVISRETSTTITLTGTPAFTVFATAQRSSGMLVPSITFSGSATGARYSAGGLSRINTFGGGASYLPGDSAGAADASTYSYYD